MRSYCAKKCSGRSWCQNVLVPKGVVGEVGGVNKGVLVPKGVVGEVGGVNKSVLAPKGVVGEVGGADKKEDV